MRRDGGGRRSNAGDRAAGETEARAAAGPAADEDYLGGLFGGGIRLRFRPLSLAGVRFGGLNSVAARDARDRWAPALTPRRVGPLQPLRARVDPSECLPKGFGRWIDGGLWGSSRVAAPKFMRAKLGPNSHLSSLFERHIYGNPTRAGESCLA